MAVLSMGVYLVNTGTPYSNSLVNCNTGLHLKHTLASMRQCTAAGHINDSREQVEAESLFVLLRQVQQLAGAWHQVLQYLPLHLSATAPLTSSDS